MGLVWVQVVFEGMNVLLPLFTSDLLRHHKLSDAFFRLLLQLCETYPSRVGAMPESHFSPLMQSLDWGLAQEESQVRSRCLGALSALAAFHHSEVQAKRPGLVVHHLQGTCNDLYLGVLSFASPTSYASLHKDGVFF